MTRVVFRDDVSDHTNGDRDENSPSASSHVSSAHRQVN